MKHILPTIVALLLSTLAALHAADTPKPNIVFIFADDWGWGDLSCHGHPWLKTPNLDRLAKEGTDFQQFNVLNPVCSPSRTAATTGMYPARFCVHQHFAPGANVQRGMPDWLDPKAPTLARFLKGAGYRTGHFGKWHLTNRGAAGAPQPAAYGFDESAVFNGPGVEAGLHDTASNAVRFIRASKGSPFYVNVWLHESHTPHVPTPEFMAMWKHLDEKKQVYSAVITDGDNAVGQVLAALKEAGVEENTLVIFSADNPEIVARLSKLALDWKARLPEKPNPDCISQQAQPMKQSSGQATKVAPGQRARAFARWDTNKDGVLTLDEYKAGLKGQGGLEARFNNFDKIGDGKLTREEFVGPAAK